MRAVEESQTSTSNAQVRSTARAVQVDHQSSSRRRPAYHSDKLSRVPSVASSMSWDSDTEWDPLNEEEA